MQRFPILGVLLLIPALVLFGAVGCSPKGGDKGDAKDKGDKGTAEKGDKPKEKEKTSAITTPLDATVKGVVKFSGKPPERKEIPALLKHKDAPACMKGDDKEQLWIVDNDGGVANVIISLTPPAGKKFDLSDKLKELSKKTVVLDQPACAYVPHVVALWPETQELVSKNDSPVNHNVKIGGSSFVGPFDFTVLPKNETPKISLKGANTDFMQAECSIHGWMNAKIALFKDPYFAVTNDKGEFTIKNVPIDTELTVYMWHESMPKKMEVEKKTFTKGDNPLKTFEIK
jgi:hypothetical protein